MLYQQHNRLVNFLHSSPGSLMSDMCPTWVIVSAEFHTGSYQTMLYWDLESDWILTNQLKWMITSTRESVAIVLSTHPCISRCVWVKHQMFTIFISEGAVTKPSFLLWNRALCPSCQMHLGWNSVRLALSAVSICKHNVMNPFLVNTGSDTQDTERSCLLLDHHIVTPSLWWKFHFPLIYTLLKLSLQNFCTWHLNRLLLSWHAKNMQGYADLEQSYSKSQLQSNLNYSRNIISEMGPTTTPVLVHYCQNTTWRQK